MLDLETVDLGLICEALEDHSPDHAWWIDPRTGDVEPWFESWLEEEADEAPESRGFIRIEPAPSSESYGDLEDFVSRVRDHLARGLLERAIRGRGAFRRFKDTLFEFPELREAWFKFHDARMERGRRSASGTLNHHRGCAGPGGGRGAGLGRAPAKMGAMATATASPQPPGPRLPRLLQTLGFIFFSRHFIDGCRRRYGDVVTFSSLFDSRFVMVFDPELVKQVFRGPPEQLRAGEANAVLRPVVGDRSVLLLDGADHMRERRLLLPPFHGERMRTYETVMREAADRAIDSWPVGEPFALLPAMQSLTLDVIMRTVFGVDAAPRREELKRRVRAMLDPVASRSGVLVLALSGGRIGSGAGQRFEERRRALDDLIYEEIARRRAVPDLERREDILSMLLVARDEDGEEMTDRELRDELVTLLVAGHETTATALAWAFELLMHNPPALGRLRAALAEDDERHLEAVVKETLRLRPVILGVGRVVREQPYELGGYLIPPGIEINPSIAAIHRRSDCYPDPEAFRPERFLGPDAPDTYTWLPFGGGTRRCLGASFATFEMRVVIRRVLERASLAPVGRRPDRGVRRGITFVPKRGVRAIQATPPLPAGGADEPGERPETPELGLVGGGR